MLYRIIMRSWQLLARSIQKLHLQVQLYMTMAGCGRWATVGGGAPDRLGLVATRRAKLKPELALLLRHPPVPLFAPITQMKELPFFYMHGTTRYGSTRSWCKSFGYRASFACQYVESTPREPSCRSLEQHKQTGARSLSR